MSEQEETLAAIDLGSNSFHLIVGKMVDDQLRVVDTYKEMVRLAGGLDKRQRLKASAQKQALECLERLGQRIQGIAPENIRVVGTNTLRKAKNAADFIAKGEAALGHRIEIISGMEEARLIYLGVAHSLPSRQGKRLVVDIGGGSTEVIVGEDFEPITRESLHMGCVSMTKLCFEKGVITAESWQRALTVARLELLPIVRPFRELGWTHAVGASGTLKTVAKVLEAQGWSPTGKITFDGLKKLVEALLEAGSSDKLELGGLSDERQPIFVGGVAIIYALFEALGLEEMIPSKTALREGVVYDLSGRQQHQDVRGRTIDNLLRRYHIDSSHAERVMRLLIKMVSKCEESLQLDQEDIALLLWAAELHEIGLAVAHSSYHKHGAYLIENADLPGFSHSEQKMLALLVRLQRRKMGAKLVDALQQGKRDKVMRILLLLRLALVLRRDRADESIEIEGIGWKDDCLAITFESEWLDSRPLTRADLAQENVFLETVGLKLNYA